MTQTLELHEAGGRIPMRELDGDKYKVRIMGWEPGAEYTHGSSADYPVEALKRDVPTSFPEGTRMKANHDGMCEAGGDIRRVIARTIDTPWAEADGMYTNIRVSQEWAGYVKEYGDIIGLSISAAGELLQQENEDGDMVNAVNEETGKPILKRLLSAEESPYNSIDFVEAPGADGRIVLALEAAQKTLLELNIREQATFAAGITERKTSKAVPPRSNQEGDIDMDEATLKSILESNNAGLLAKIDEKIAEKLPVTEDSETPKLDVVAEAIVSAGLTEAGRANVYEKVALGVNFEKAIESEKAREKSIRDELSESLKSEATASGIVTEDGKPGSYKGDLNAELDEYLGFNTPKDVI